jgi:hypothetical protein
MRRCLANPVRLENETLEGVWNYLCGFVLVYEIANNSSEGGSREFNKKRSEDILGERRTRRRSKRGAQGRSGRQEDAYHQ